MTQIKMVFPTKVNILHETENENQNNTTDKNSSSRKSEKNNMSFSIWKPFVLIAWRDLENHYRFLK